MSLEKFVRLKTLDGFVTEKFDILKNKLLGNYDSNNNYFISPEIVNELLKLKKYKKTSFENSMFCTGNVLGYGEIAFQLEINDKTTDGNTAESFLYVLEDVNKINGYMQNVLKTKIGSFKAPLNRFVESSFVYFHIVENDSDEGMDRKSLDELDNTNTFIMAKKQYMLMLEKLTDDQILEEYGKYFSKRIECLTKIDNDFSRDVLTSFNSQYEKISKIFLKQKNFKNLNELLDKSIEEISDTKEIYKVQQKVYDDEIKDSLDLFIKNIDEINIKNKNIALNMLEKNDKEKISLMNDSENKHNIELKNIKEVIKKEVLDKDIKEKEIDVNEKTLEKDSKVEKSNSSDLEKKLNDNLESKSNIKDNKISKQEIKIDIKDSASKLDNVEKLNDIKDLLKKEENKDFDNKEKKQEKQNIEKIIEQKINEEKVKNSLNQKKVEDKSVNSDQLKIKLETLVNSLKQKDLKNKNNSAKNSKSQNTTKLSATNNDLGGVLLDIQNEATSSTEMERY